MASHEHLEILTKGVGAWNEWRQGDPEERPDLSGAHLHSANLRGANLAGAALSRADLSGALLTSAELTLADLSGANFIDADLRMTRLQNANLTGATMVGADLSGADLKNANLSNADLSGVYLRATRLVQTVMTAARLRGTTLAELDLRGAVGLETARHDGPSTIGIDTLYRSGGVIPEVFLRGAGVPEEFIAYANSLTASALEFYSCFISYSTQDQAFADRLYAGLQERGVRCWFAPHDIQGGRKIHEQIDEAVRLFDKLLLILSDASMNSNWVRTELANARAKETAQKKQMLFPVSLVPFDRIRSWKQFDADTGLDTAREIREYYIPDFSNWKDERSFAREFERLVRDLKAGAPVPKEL
jgi:hypothetical protein